MAVSLLDRLAAMVAVAVSEFDAAGLWELDGRPTWCLRPRPVCATAVVANLNDKTVSVFGEHEHERVPVLALCRRPSAVGPWARGPPMSTPTDPSPPRLVVPCTARRPWTGATS
ncbi:MAG: hypothetical protein ACRD1K_10450 [Acidimicrobiales bacterium]